MNTSKSLTLKLLSRDWEVMSLSPWNSLLCKKKQGKAAYNKPNGGTLLWTMRMRGFSAPGGLFFFISCTRKGCLDWLFEFIYWPKH